MHFVERPLCWPPHCEPTYRQESLVRHVLPVISNRQVPFLIYSCELFCVLPAAREKAPKSQCGPKYATKRLYTSVTNQNETALGDSALPIFLLVWPNMYGLHSAIAWRTFHYGDRTLTTFSIAQLVSRWRVRANDKITSDTFGSAPSSWAIIFALTHLYVYLLEKFRPVCCSIQSALDIIMLKTVCRTILAKCGRYVIIKHVFLILAPLVIMSLERNAEMLRKAIFETFTRGHVVFGQCHYCILTIWLIFVRTIWNWQYNMSNSEIICCRSYHIALVRRGWKRLIRPSL